MQSCESARRSQRRQAWPRRVAKRPFDARIARIERCVSRYWMSYRALPGMSSPLLQAPGQQVLGLPKAGDSDRHADNRTAHVATVNTEGQCHCFTSPLATFLFCCTGAVSPPASVARALRRPCARPPASSLAS